MDGERLCFTEFLLEKRELTQFIRKTGPKTIQLRSIDRTTRGAENPERLRSIDHTTGCTPVGWIGTSTHTAQLNNSTFIGRIGTTTRSTQTTSKENRARKSYNECIIWHSFELAFRPFLRHFQISYLTNKAKGQLQHE
jgi:hypothetical protein